MGRFWFMAALLASCEGGFRIELRDGQNYYLEQELEVMFQQVAAGEDTRVDWSGLDSGLFGDEIDPQDPDLLNLWRCEAGTTLEDPALDQEALLELLSFQDSCTGYYTYEPSAGETSALLSQFGFHGTMLDVQTEVLEDARFFVWTYAEWYSWAGMAAFDPVEGAASTTVVIDESSSWLLESAFPGASVPVERARSYQADWMELMTDGKGNELALSNIDQLALRRSDRSEGDPLEFYETAEDSYAADVEGLGELDLSLAESVDGAPFPGFDDEGSWQLALECSSCPNPVPLFLSFVGLE